MKAGDYPYDKYWDATDGPHVGEELAKKEAAAKLPRLKWWQHALRVFTPVFWLMEKTIDGVLYVSNEIYWWNYKRKKARGSS